MRKFLLSALAILVAMGLMGSAFAYFSDTESSEGNTFTAGIMGLQDPADNVILIPNAYPGYTPDLHKIYVDMNTDTTIDPDHMEIDVDTYDFVDWLVGESGGPNTAADFTKQIEVLTLWWYDSEGNNNLLAMVDDYEDSNPNFISLYDVEAYGVFDNLYDLGMTGSGRLDVKLAMPLDLPDVDDDKYQGDSIKIRFEFGVAQVPGQSVLED